MQKGRAMADSAIEQIGLGVKKFNRRRRKKKTLPFAFPNSKETAKVESKPQGPTEPIEKAIAIKPARDQKDSPPKIKRSAKFKTADIEIIYTTEDARENGARSEIKFGDTSDGGTNVTSSTRTQRWNYYREQQHYYQINRGGAGSGRLAHNSYEHQQYYQEYRGEAGSGGLAHNSLEPQYSYPKGTTAQQRGFVGDAQDPIESQYFYPKSRGRAESGWGFQNPQDRKDTGRTPNHQFHKMNYPDKNRYSLRKFDKETMQLRSGTFTREIAPKSEPKDFKIHARAPPKEKSKKTEKIEQDKISYKNKDKIQQSAIQLPATEVKEKKRGWPKKSIIPSPVVENGEKKRGRPKISTSPVVAGAKKRGWSKKFISPLTVVAEEAKKKPEKSISPPSVAEGKKKGVRPKKIIRPTVVEEEAELGCTAQSKVSSTTNKKNKKAGAAKGGAQNSGFIPVEKEKHNKKKNVSAKKN